MSLYSMTGEVRENSLVSQWIGRLGLALRRREMRSIIFFTPRNSCPSADTCIRRPNVIECLFTS
jgi:hypothetical protein